MSKSIEDEIRSLPSGQALHLYHRGSGSWAIQRLVFGPGLLSRIEKFHREGATLEEAFAANETEYRD